MRWFLLWAALLCGSANAQMLQSIVNAKTAAACSYTGPGNIVSGAFAWWGFRSYSCAFAASGTGKAVNYRRASDNATQDGVIKTDGTFDIATANTFAGPDGGTGVCTASTTGSSTTLTITTCATSATLHAGDTLSCSSCVQPVYITALGSFSGTGAGAAGTVTLNAAQNITAQSVTSQVALFVTKLYDQSGGTNDVSQATSGNQPYLLPKCANSGTLPCLGNVTASGLSLCNASVSGNSQPISFSAVAIRTSVSGFPTLLAYDDAANSPVLQWRNTPDTLALYAGTGPLTATATDGGWHALQAVANANLSDINVDGTQTIGAAGTTASATRVCFFGGSNTNPLGYATEGGIWALGFTSTQETNLQLNQKAWYNTP